MRWYARRCSSQGRVAGEAAVSSLGSAPELSLACQQTHQACYLSDRQEAVAAAGSTDAAKQLQSGGNQVTERTSTAWAHLERPIFGSVVHHMQQLHAVHCSSSSKYRVSRTQLPGLWPGRPDPARRKAKLPPSRCQQATAPGPACMPGLTLQVHGPPVHPGVAVAALVQPLLKVCKEHVAACRTEGREGGGHTDACEPALPDRPMLLLSYWQVHTALLASAHSAAPNTTAVRQQPRHKQGAPRMHALWGRAGCCLTSGRFS